jgi:hypothetical protein
MAYSLLMIKPLRARRLPEPISNIPQDEAEECYNAVLDEQQLAA